MRTAFRLLPFLLAAAVGCEKVEFDLLPEPSSEGGTAGEGGDDHGAKGGDSGRGGAAGRGGSGGSLAAGGTSGGGGTAGTATGGVYGTSGNTSSGGTAGSGAGGTAGQSECPGGACPPPPCGPDNPCRCGGQDCPKHMPYCGGPDRSLCVECTKTAHCSLALEQACVFNSCTPTCERDYDCKDDPYRNLCVPSPSSGLGYCVQCRLHSDCERWPETPICVDTWGRCYPCQYDEQCDVLAGERCDTETGACKVPESAPSP